MNKSEIISSKSCDKIIGQYYEESFIQILKFSWEDYLLNIVPCDLINIMENKTIIGTGSLRKDIFRKQSNY